MLLIFAQVSGSNSFELCRCAVVCSVLAAGVWVQQMVPDTDRAGTEGNQSEDLAP